MLRAYERALIDLRECPGVLDSAECATLIERHRAGLQRSTVTVDAVQAWGRTCSSSKIELQRDDIDRKLACFVEAQGGNPSHLESWEIVRYGIGERYQRHIDYFEVSDKGPRGNRIASIIVYLNEPYSGGETAFPLLKRTVRPKIGKAIYWRNVHEGRGLRLTVHEALPVRAGEKWVLVNWLRER